MSKKVESFVGNSESVILTDDAIYSIEMLVGIDELKEPRDDTAYIINDVYYLFRGKPRVLDTMMLKPGIYETKVDGETSYFLIEPRNEEEVEEYKASTHMNSLDPVQVINEANVKEDLLIAIPESTKVFQAVLSDDDDILKRAAKLALIKKNVDLERCKDRFSNKNELFNFKQVMRGKNKVSILIFSRGCEALNLIFEIVIKEKSDTYCVGDRLVEPIVVSSEDTYEF